ENGVPERAPYDRIIVTVGAWDIPPAWVEQLATGGRIVIPLRMRGLTRSLALDRDGDHLVSRSAMICGFVKIRGAGAHQERVLPLRGVEVRLRFDDGWQSEHELDGVLGTQRAEVWSGVTIGGRESFETLQFWLATTFPGFCRLAADADQSSVLVDPGTQWYDLAAVDGDSFAYLTTRRVGPGKSEFGAHAFGPHSPAAAEAMVEQVRVWDRDRRSGAGPDFAVWPKDTPDEALPQGLIINKRYNRVTISWPAEAAERVAPSAGLCQCAGAIGQQDGPQEFPKFLALFRLAYEPSEVDVSAVDSRGRLGSHRVMSVFEDLVRAGAVAAARGQAAEVDDRLKRELRRLHGERCGGLEDVELAPA
ncbi:MAG: hypothetical protein ACRD1G_06955, partial [Acidimicrobiales bacterium]